MIKSNGLGLKKLFEWSTFIFCIWYFMPAVNVAFQSTVFKLAFFACFMTGLVGYMMCNGFRINGVTLSILIYYLIFAIFFVFGIGDASAHIRVSFIFWGLGLMFFGVIDEKSKVSLGKKLLFIFVITCITSAIGVLLDNDAARTIAHAAADDAIQNSYKAKNIASIYLFQCIVCFIPPLVLISKTKKAKICCAIALVTILLILLNASFTISIIVYVFAILLSFCFNQNVARGFAATLLLTVVVLLVFLNGSTVLSYVASIIENPRISERIYGLRDLVYNDVYDSDAGLRFELYATSFKTFLENPFGVGPYYSYNEFENGIGYHSKIFDDLARYGVFAIAFYVVFFVGYYRALKKEWEKIEAGKVAGVVVLTYILFLILNIGHRSGEESICMMFIMPALPSIILDYRQKKQKKN